jgi:hypothetical protein
MLTARKIDSATTSPPGPQKLRRAARVASGESNVHLHAAHNRGYCGVGMQDLQLQVPATDEVEGDAATLAAIDRGVKAADEGRTVSLEEARNMIPKWISKSPNATTVKTMRAADQGKGKRLTSAGRCSRTWGSDLVHLVRTGTHSDLF